MLRVIKKAGSSWLKTLCAGVMLVSLVACGGGGNAGNSVFNGGSSSGGSTGTANAPTVTVSISSTAVTAAAPGTVSAVVKSSTGSALSGQLVTFSTKLGLGIFSANSALTDSTGTATVTISPASATSNGADYAIASVTTAATSSSTTGTTTTGQIGFTVAATSVPAASFTLNLSTQTITAAAPAILTATLTSASGAPLPGQVVTFKSATNLGTFSAATALTNSNGVATTTMFPTVATSAGADIVTASVTANGTNLAASAGFQVAATNVTITSFTDSVPANAALAAYGQTNLSLVLAGTISTSPVNVAVSSQCVTAGKATLTPSSLSTTTGTASFSYVDKGCGAVQTKDNLTVTAGAATMPLTINLTTPTVATMTFVSASQSTLFLSTSNTAPQTSTLTFQLSDQNGNGVPGQTVWLTPSTTTGGLTMNGNSVCNSTNLATQNPGQLGCVSRVTDSLGQVSAIVNSGTQPTSISVQASYALPGSGTITSSSNSLSVAIGLPSQERFSLSQQFFNIEAYNVDNSPNTYTVFAGDRMGNPVPAKTAFNLVNTMGQVLTQPLTSSSTAISSVSVVSASGGQRPNQWDGRVTTVAYSIGNMAFVDLNGTNAYNSVTDPSKNLVSDPYQNLGDVYLDPKFRGFYASGLQTIPYGGSSACPVPTTQSFYLYDEVNGAAPASSSGYSAYVTPSVPAEPNTCQNAWGQAYVRSAIQTIWSTSDANPSWGPSLPPGVYAQDLASCPTAKPLIYSYQANTAGTPNMVSVYPINGTQIYNITSQTFSFLAADNNQYAFNPMAAGTVVSVTAVPTAAFSVANLLGGNPVPNAYHPPSVVFGYAFATGYSSGTLLFTFKSPVTGTVTAASVFITTSPPPAGYVACP